MSRLIGAAAMLYLGHCTDELIRAFDDAGIGVIVLKGPAVARVLYSPYERRSYGDVDLLIEPSKNGAARRVLADLGYQQRHPGAALTEAGLYAEEYTRKSAMVDLHLWYPGISVEPAVAWEILAEIVERVVIREVPLPVLRPEGVALIVALHTAKTPGGPTGDIQRAVDRFPDETWRQAFLLGESLGSVPMMVVGVQRARGGHALLGRLGVDVTLPASAQLLVSIPPPLALGIERLWATRGIGNRLRLAAREVVPSTDGLRYWSPLARQGRVGLIAAYVWRPFWLAWKLPAALRAWMRAHRAASASVPPSGRKDDSSGPPSR